MKAVLIGILILDSALLITAVLFQAGQGGGLASLGGAGTDMVMGGRQAVTLLHKITWWCGGTFLGLALVLALLSSRSSSEPRPLIEGGGTPAPVAPAPLPLQTPPPAQNQAPAPAQPPPPNR